MKHFRFDRSHGGKYIPRITYLALLLLSAGVLSAQTADDPAGADTEIPAVRPSSRGAVSTGPAKNEAGGASYFKTSDSRATSDSDLPDAPGESSSVMTAGRGAAIPFAAGGAPIHMNPVAPLYHKYIEPGEKAQPLASADKVLFGVHQLMSPYLLLTIATAAGYEHAVNGSPNYGTNFPAYGQRLGAAAIRDASQTIFEDSVMAPILHEDPRYYVMGNRRNALVRATYAVSRVFVTRTDDGSRTPNYSLFAGYAGAAALENAYYPDDNHGFSETAKSFGGSIGGAALSNVVREFLPDILHATHIER